MTLRRTLTTLVLMAALGTWRGQADEVSSAGRTLVQSHEKAIVTVRLTVKMTYSMAGFGSEEEEVIQEVTGTVIQPDGLTVLSLTATDPSSVFEQMMGMIGGESEGFSFNTQVTDVRLIMADGKEVPGKVVLRDRDLDLAFVRPGETPAEPLAALDLSQNTKPEQMDELVVLFRLGKVAGRACGGEARRVQALVEKPRLLYFLSQFAPFGSAAESSLGAPAFTVDGRCVGVVVLRTLKSSGTREPEMAIVVLPAQDVLEVAQQAPLEAAPEETAPIEIELPQQPAGG